MKNLLVSALVLVSLVISGMSASAEEYKMTQPAVFSLISGDIPLSKEFKINLTMLHTWLAIGSGTPTSLYSFLSVPVDFNGTTVSPGIGVVNNFPEPGRSAGTLTCAVFGQIGKVVHYNEIDIYLSSSQVNYWITTRWLIQPFSLPFNVGGQGWLYDGTLDVAPEISYSFSHLDIGVQWVFGMLGNKTHYPQLVIRSTF